MKQIKTLVFYGFLVWVIPFVAAILIFPLRQSERPLFESIMPVVLVLAVVVLTRYYFKKFEPVSLKDGFGVGAVWLFISLVIDGLMFVRGPMAMALGDYFKDIGLTYLIIPAITIGFASFISSKTKPLES